jgi:hypothetical protein
MAGRIPPRDQETIGYRRRQRNEDKMGDTG